MANRRREIDPEKGKRLDVVLKDAGITPKELATLMGKPHQNIYELIHSKRNLTEETAKDIIVALGEYEQRHLPSYRWQYLVGYDNYKTIAEEVLARRDKEIDNLDQLLFLLMAEATHREAWAMNSFVMPAETPEDEDGFIDSSALREVENGYLGSVSIKVGRDEICLPKEQLEAFMKRMLDYFLFELDHFDFNPR